MKKYLAAAPKPKTTGFWDHEPRELAAKHQFVEQLEMAITLANREVIHGQIPNLSQDTFQQLAVMVARFRANYLAAAIRLSDAHDPPDASRLAELKRMRELFDEGCAAFEALQRAIARGYVDIGETR